MRLCVIVAILILAITKVWANIAPVVNNVHVVQQPFPSELVQIIYDIFDADGDAMIVSLQISSDGGVSWTVPVSTVTGSIGNGILSGVNYEIIWNAGVDYPGHSGTQYKAKISANDNNGPEGMVLVPAGQYSMGADYWSPYSVPRHTVSLPTFHMDVYEVTNSRYKAFCDATSRAYPPDPGFSGMPDYFTNPVYANYPVVQVSWYDASAYASWAGKRLPTEAEWERAAKGNEDNRQWPWGDTWIATNANVSYNPSDGYTNTAPVGNYPGGISPAGCYDMAGNVWEWVEDDWHDNYSGAPTNGSAWINNPRVSERVERGGSWDITYSYNRCGIREHNNPALSNRNIGFRCARNS